MDPYPSSLIFPPLGGVRRPLTADVLIPAQVQSVVQPEFPSKSSDKFSLCGVTKSVSLNLLSVYPRRTL